MKVERIHGGRWWILFVLLGVGGCATDPVTGKSHFSAVHWTNAEEVEIGGEAAPNVESQFEAIAPNREANEVLGKLISEMVSHSVRKDDFEFRFKVLNSSVPNALALPGGFVYVTRGLLQMIESEGQFISIIGHELGHVEHRHSMANQSRARVTGFFTAPFRLVVGLTSGLPGSRVVGVAAGVVVAPLGLWGLKYNRDQETESDERGVFFAAAMRYDPNEGIKTFEMFERLEQAAGGSELSWGRTHPLNKDRVQNIEKIIARSYPGLLNKPQSQFRQSSVRFSRVIERFKRMVPAMKLYDDAQVLLAKPDVSPAELEKAQAKLDEARSVLPDEPLVHIGLGEADFLKQKFDDAKAHLIEARAIYDRQSPGDSSWKVHFYLGVIHLHEKDNRTAAEQLLIATQRFPLHPAPHLFLGIAYEAGGQSERARKAYRKTLLLTSQDSELQTEARVRMRKL